MYRNPEPYVPKTKGEIWDFLGSMMLSAPTFIDKSGYFPDRNLESEFFALNEGLKAIRKQTGEENYQKLADLSARMRAHFEADPEDKTDDSVKGRECILEMEDILRAAGRRKR
jgi:hypothetical protein